MCRQHQLVLFAGWWAAAGAAAQGPVWEEDSVSFIQKVGRTTELVVASLQSKVFATEWRGNLRVRSNDKCVEGNTDDVGYLHMGNCHDGLNQVFEMHDDKRMTMQHDNSRCVLIDPYASSLYMGDCSGYDDDQFYFENEQLRTVRENFDNKCWTDGGDRLNMEDCHTGDNQNFFVEYVPTSAPTRAPTAAQAGAEGDPHLTNMHGKTFDLNVVGEHVLVQVPAVSGTDFRLRGVVEQLPVKKGKMCQFFFTKLMFDGNWVGGPVVVSAGDFHTSGNFTMTHDHDVLTLDQLASRGPQKVTKLGVEQCSKDMNDKRDQALCSKVHKLVMKKHRRLISVLVKPHSPLPLRIITSRFESPGYLNVHVDGFDGVADQLSGLLGGDDFTKLAEQTPDECQRRPLSFRRLARNSGKVSGNFIVGVMGE